MQRKDDANDELLCSFCGKSQDEVKKLIAGPSVYICDECIQLCNEIIAEEYGQEAEKEGAEQLPKPYEIKALLDEYVIEQERPKKILAASQRIVLSTCLASIPIRGCAQPLQTNWRKYRYGGCRDPKEQYPFDRAHRVRQDPSGSDPCQDT